MTSAVGLVLWLQHWHWYPMMHMFSLALTPTYTIGLNKVSRLSAEPGLPDFNCTI
jgi:26S proteasome regulatory subunit N2